MLHGYILGVLTHTTTWNQHWGGGDETLTVPAPLTDAATIQELSFWSLDYRIKNA